MNYLGFVIEITNFFQKINRSLENASEKALKSIFSRIQCQDIIILSIKTSRVTLAIPNYQIANISK